MADCIACEAASTNPYAGMYIDGCIGCSIRYTSQQPRARRDLIISAVTDPAARERFKADCIAEYHRREALKAGRPLQ